MQRWRLTFVRWAFVVVEYDADRGNPWVPIRSAGDVERLPVEAGSSGRAGCIACQSLPRRDLLPRSRSRPTRLDARLVLIAVRCSPLGAAQPAGERCGQPLVVGRLVVALGRDPDQDLLRRSAASHCQDRPARRSVPRSILGQETPRELLGRGLARHPRKRDRRHRTSIESGAGGADAQRLMREVSTSQRQRVVGRHDRRPAAAFRFERRHPVDRGRHGQERRGSDVPTQSNSAGTASGRRGPRSRHGIRPADARQHAGRRGPRGSRNPSGCTPICARCRSTTPSETPRSSGIMPGACAPSTRVSTPRRASCATSSSIGRMRAVGLVTWLISRSRVRGVTAASTASAASPGSEIGKGIRATTTRAPSRVATAARALSVALYSWSVVSELVAGLEPERAQDRVDPGRRVRDKRHAIRIGAEKGAHPTPRGIEELREVPRQEPNRFGLHPIPKGLLVLEHRHRARPVRTVVQVGNARIQAPADVDLHRQDDRSSGGVTSFIGGGSSRSPRRRSRWIRPGAAMNGAMNAISRIGTRTRLPGNSPTSIAPSHSMRAYRPIDRPDQPAKLHTPRGQQDEQRRSAARAQGRTGRGSSPDHTAPMAVSRAAASRPVRCTAARSGRAGRYAPRT